MSPRSGPPRSPEQVLSSLDTEPDKAPGRRSPKAPLVEPSAPLESMVAEAARILSAEQDQLDERRRLAGELRRRLEEGDLSIGDHELIEAENLVSVSESRVKGAQARLTKARETELIRRADELWVEGKAVVPPLVERVGETYDDLVEALRAHIAADGERSAGVEGIRRRHAELVAETPDGAEVPRELSRFDVFGRFGVAGISLDPWNLQSAVLALVVEAFRSSRHQTPVERAALENAVPPGAKGELGKLRRATGRSPISAVSDHAADADAPLGWKPEYQGPEFAAG